MEYKMNDKTQVYLVGAGPGDTGLITVKGLQCLQKAEVVLYDKLSNPAFLALNCILVRISGCLIIFCR